MPAPAPICPLFPYTTLFRSVPMARVTLPVKPVAVLPFASRAVTSMAGVMLAPAKVVGAYVGTTTTSRPRVVMFESELVPTTLPLPAVGDQFVVRYSIGCYAD